MQGDIDSLFESMAPQQSAAQAGVLTGNDNWRKSFFFRSFRHKAPNSSSIVVVRYTSNGELVTVGDYPEEHRFILTGASMSRVENVQLLQTFGDDQTIVQTGGARPQIWQFKGVLRNEARESQIVSTFLDDGSTKYEYAGDGDWRNGFSEAYDNHLRASQLVRRGQFLELRVGDMFVYGYIFSLTMNETSENDLMVPFNMQFFVRNVRVPGYVDINSQLARLESTDPQ